MIYLKLFLTFFKIGAVSFGGGYAMIPLIREAVLSHGWLTEEELVDFIAVAESTPGPVAVNIATFIGSTKAGLLGSIISTLGVITPSFIIILIIAAILKNLLKYKGVQGFLAGIRPVIVALILGTAVTIGLSTLFAFSDVSVKPVPNLMGIIIFLCLLAVHFGCRLIAKKKPSPIIMILLSAGLGILFNSIM
ncbi:MAG: chromate transporter [Lachnospiraceae bacterium]|nr:chromate transporter [Lachnospiraceae bacterium]